MINLYTSYYNEPNTERAKELEKCLLENAKNKLIDTIYVIVENEHQVEDLIHISVKLKYHIVSKIPTFENFFKFINVVSGENDINIVSNSDIIFDETLGLTNQLNENDCWALSRWEINQDGSKGEIIQKYGDSQDCFIFRCQIKPIEYCDFPLGMMGCDNRIAHEIQKAGYNITNPCLSVKTWHLHNTNHRNYDAGVRNENTVVQPPYLTLPLTKL